MSNKLIRLKDVLTLTGLSRSCVYSLAQREMFPRPVKLTKRSSAWVESEVRAWIEERITQRNEEVA